MHHDITLLKHIQLDYGLKCALSYTPICIILWHRPVVLLLPPPIFKKKYRYKKTQLGLKRISTSSLQLLVENNAEENKEFDEVRLVLCIFQQWILIINGLKVCCYRDRGGSNNTVLTSSGVKQMQYVVRCCLKFSPIIMP